MCSSSLTYLLCSLPPNPQERKGLDEETRHFSYFGFEGATGALRWVHEVSGRLLCICVLRR